MDTTVLRRNLALQKGLQISEHEPGMWNCDWEMNASISKIAKLVSNYRMIGK
jgi:hypothetical protein